MTEKQLILSIKTVILIAAAYLSSGIIVQMIRWNIPATIPEVSHDAPTVAKADRTRNLDYYSTVWEKNVFNPEGKVSGEKAGVEETQVAEEITPAEEEINLPLSSLNYKLIGTVTGYPDGSFAVIFVPEEKEQKLYRIGDNVGKARLVRISRNKVVLNNAGREEMLEVKFDNALREIGGASNSRISADRGVKKVSANKYILDKEEVENLSGDVTQFMTQVRVIPNIIGGKPSGYKLINIKRGSLIEKIGFQNGDIVKEINGKSIDRPEEAYLAYQQLKGGSGFTIEIERGGRRESIYYEIR